MSHSSSWSAPPLQVLQAVFERQQNALDNAAAACACKAWRAAVNSSTAQALHLHANSISNCQEWGSCLKAYSSICCLKLTASYHLSHMANAELASVQHSMFNSIPEACDTLCVRAPFVGAAHFYTDRQVHLEASILVPRLETSHGPEDSAASCLRQLKELALRQAA